MPFLSFLRANAPFLLAGFLLNYLSSFGQTHVIAVFAGDLRTAFDLSHGHWGAIYAAATMTSAAIMLWGGGLADRFRVRGLGTLVLIGLALALLALAANPTVWLLPVAIFLLRFFGQGMAVQAAGVAISRWFVGNRGRALAVAALGFSAGEVTVPLTMVSLKALIGWRPTLVVAAGVVLILLPLLRYLLRLERTPQSIARENPVAGLQGRHWTRGEVLRHPLFWALLPALMSTPVFLTVVFFQQVVLAEVLGWPHLRLVALFPTFTVAAVAVLFLSGWAVDRWGSRWLMPLYPLPMALAFLIFPFADGPVMVAIFFMTLGLTAGSQATISVAVWAEVYGTNHLGAVRALAGAALVLGSALGPLMSGVLIDMGIGLRAQMPFYALATLVASGLALWGLRRAFKGAAA